MPRLSLTTAELADVLSILSSRAALLAEQADEVERAGGGEHAESRERIDRLYRTIGKLDAARRRRP
jgi:hypothetical protein